MRVGVAGGVALVLVLAALILGYSSMFTVYQTRQALVVRLGDPVRTVTEPGLHAKLPLIDTVMTSGLTPASWSYVMPSRLATPAR